MPSAPSAEPGLEPAHGAHHGHAPAARILIVRLGAMGDILHTLPAVGALRHALPGATLAWAVDERWAELLCSRGSEDGPRGSLKPLVDVLHRLRVGAWRRAPLAGETSRQMRAAARELRAAHYEVALDFQGAIRSALVARAAGVRRRIGFQSPREAPAGLLYTHRVSAGGAHMVEQNLSLVRALVPSAGPAAGFDLPVDPAAEAWADAEVQRLGGRPFALMNPGAGWGAKQWPAGRYGEAAKRLKRLGLGSLVNFGPGEDATAREVVQASGEGAAAISCSVGQLIALTRRARLFLGGDTGPLHLACALAIPVVAIYGPTDPARNGPYGTRSIVLRSPESRTSHARRRRTESGLLKITADEVVLAARRLLEEA